MNRPTVINFLKPLCTSLTSQATFKLAPLACTLVLLASCGSTPTKTDNTENALVMSLDEIQSVLESTSSMADGARIDQQLEALEALLHYKEFDWAHRVADSIDHRAANENQFVRIMLLRGKVALAEGEPYQARHYLFNPQVDGFLTSTDIEVSKDLLDLRATLMFDHAEFLRAVDERLALAKLLDDEMMQQLNHDLIWEALAEISTNELFTLAKTEKEAIKQGWYSLAALSKNNGANFRQQILDINNWREIWPAHPANALLPADLQLILQLADEQAKQIAVLLPFSGSLAGAGSAIKEGILAAYYNGTSNNYASPDLRFYDTHAHDINTLYEQAMLEGAELVIGPLSKTNVSLLAARVDLPIPVLALNSISSEAVSADNELMESTSLEITEAEPITTVPVGMDDLDTTETEIISDQRASQNLYQFSLGIEAETQQVALRAWRDGHRQALVIAPLSEWGDRAVQAFAEEWQKLGGTLIADQRYRDQRSYSSLIERSLDVDTSKQRYTEMRRLFGKEMEFEPRRRDDIDFIFMLSHAAQGTQLKPLLAFHYAGDVPVYATSHIYDGKEGKATADLNGIRFSTLPWYFESTRNERRAIQAYGDNVAQLQSLYAMGVDAFHIYPRLEQLKLIRQARFYGSTGKLSVAEDNTIIREQNWAEMRGGKVLELKNHSLEEEIQP